MENYMKLVKADTRLYPSTRVYFEYKWTAKCVKKHVLLTCEDITIKHSGYGSLENILNEAFNTLKERVMNKIIS